MPKRVKKKLTTEIVTDDKSREVFGQVEKRLQALEDLLATRQTKDSGRSGLFTVGYNGGVYKPVPQWQVGIRTTGRPVLVRLQLDDSGIWSFRFNGTGGSATGLDCQFFRDDTLIGTIPFSMLLQFLSSPTVSDPVFDINPEYFSKVDVPPAGEHVYRVSARTAIVSDDAQIAGVQLAVVPL